MLKRLGKFNLKNVLLYLNINSITNRSGDLDKIAEGDIDTLCKSETKLDESFLNNASIS